MRTHANPIRTSPTSRPVACMFHVTRPSKQAEIRHILHGPRIQRKLTIGISGGDVSEREAERVLGVVPREESSQLGSHPPRATSIPSVRHDSAALLAQLSLRPENVGELMATSRGRELSSAEMPPVVAFEHSDRPVLHVGREAETIAAAFNATAVTLGRDIFVEQASIPRSVLYHEIAHVAQRVNTGPSTSTQFLENEADSVAAGWEGGYSPAPRLAAHPAVALRHPAIRVLLRAGRWLARRTTNSLSKHVARHGRRIAGRAVHTVFRNPRKIKSLVTSAVSDAAALARRFATKGADEVLEEGGVRVFRQATATPGKFRTVVEKDFGRAIGTRGETVLRVVLDYSGRVVTAFPTDALRGIGAGVIALTVFTESTAEASERARTAIERSENQPTDWGEVVFDLAIDILSFGLLATTPLNEGESLMLELDRIVREAAERTIREIEAQEGIVLTDEQKESILDLAAVAVGSPMEFEGITAAAD